MARLDYENILHIFKLISLDKTALDISTKLSIARSTLYRLIKKNSRTKHVSPYRANYPYKRCIHLFQCKQEIKRCPVSCGKYQKYLCPKLKRFPFICNFCPDDSKCVKEKRYFNPEETYYKRQDRLIESRKHIKLNPKTFKSFDRWLSKQIKHGKSIEVLYHTYPERFPVSSSTVRRWINEGYLQAKRIDLRRAVKFKKKDRKRYKRRKNTDPLLKFGHTYAYFLNHLKKHPDSSIMELDTVYGKAAEKPKILTMFHRKSHLQLGFKIESLSPSNITQKMRALQALLGDDFSKVFDIILADNGGEFDNLIMSSTDTKTGEILSHVYYTRPYKSGDKGACEKNHTIFRYYIPKGNAISHLNQDDLDMMFSHINSYPRESLNWRAPIDIFKTLFDISILDKLNIQKVDVKDINFKLKRI